LSTKSSKQVSQPERTYILRKAYKRYLFDSLPPVLVFHLKRFQQVGGRWSVSMKKIDDFVAFDEELDVGDFVVPPEIEKKNENGINNGHIIDDDNNTHSLLKQNKKHTKYRLYGVVVHLGSLYNGHYIAYVLSRNIREGDHYGFSFSSDTLKKVDRIERQKHKTGSERQWIYCSDSSVRAANVEEVLKSGAYLLFYERVYE
jgi:ubiquitin C-terminal hydrolase